jgi:hypothetical protein
MYLSHVGKGGETVFPKSEPDPREKDDTWSECAKKGVSGGEQMCSLLGVQNCLLLALKRGLWDDGLRF